MTTAIKPSKFQTWTNMTRNIENKCISPHGNVNVLSAKQLETTKYVKNRNCGCTAAIVKNRSFVWETMMYGISATPGSVLFDITRTVFSRAASWVCWEMLVWNICGPTRPVFDDKMSIHAVNTTEKTKFDPITTERVSDFRLDDIRLCSRHIRSFYIIRGKNVCEFSGLGFYNFFSNLLPAIQFLADQRQPGLCRLEALSTLVTGTCELFPYTIQLLNWDSTETCTLFLFRGSAVWGRCLHRCKCASWKWGFVWSTSTIFFYYSCSVMYLREYFFYWR